MSERDKRAEADEERQPLTYTCAEPKRLRGGRVQILVTISATNQKVDNRNLRSTSGFYHWDSHSRDIAIQGVRTELVTAQVILGRGKGPLGRGERHVEQASMTKRVVWSDVNQKFPNSTREPEVTERSIEATERLNTEIPPTTIPLTEWVGQVAAIVYPPEPNSAFQLVLPNMPSGVSTQ